MHQLLFKNLLYTAATRGLANQSMGDTGGHNVITPSTSVYENKICDRDEARRVAGFSKTVIRHMCFGSKPGHK